MLLGDDHDEERGPIAEDAQEVGQDLGKVLAAGDARDCVNHKREEHPEEARDGGEGTAQGLDGETGGVRVRYIVRSAGKM